MITRFITDVTSRFNPFSSRAKVCRVFLAQFGPSSFSSIKFNTQVLPRGSAEPNTLKIKFSDGKELDLNPEKLSVLDVVEEVDRHSRILGRKEKLAG